MSIFAISFVYFCLVISVCNLHQTTSDHANKHNLGDYNNSSVLHSSSQRKLLLHEKTKLCTYKDISIAQGQIGLWRGIPQFTVEIVNTCKSSGGGQPHDIHLHCGWFASTRVVPNKTFRRLAYDDCLVNNGLPLYPGQCIRFVYSNSFKYTIALKRASFS